MPGRTAIGWADFSSNPLRARIRGGAPNKGAGGWACVRVSAGCTNCYSATLNKRLGTGFDYTVPAMEKIEVYLNEAELQRILTFRPRGQGRGTFCNCDRHYPRQSDLSCGCSNERPMYKNQRQRPIVFPCDMTDLFGEWVSDEQIDRIFAAFALRPDVDFMVLTKRPERMREYSLAKASGYVAPGDGPVLRVEGVDWPLPNVWLGVSVEDQATADARIPLLLQTPAVRRFVSYEPALGPIDFSGITIGDGWTEEAALDHRPGLGLDLVIAGGESGRYFRPCDQSWLRSARDQCNDAGVAFFCKQGSGLRPGASTGDPELDACKAMPR